MIVGGTMHPFTTFEHPSTAIALRLFVPCQRLYVYDVHKEVAPEILYIMPLALFIAVMSTTIPDKPTEFAACATFYVQATRASFRRT